MSKRYYVLALLVCLVLVVSACKQSGTTTSGAPRKPFIGGTSGLTINFVKDSPLPEVTDDSSFGFKAIVQLKNEGETKIEKNNVKVNIVGFDPEDFGATISEITEQVPDDDLEPKKMDAEGNQIEGTTTFVTIPKNKDFVPKKFTGNTEFTFRADVCYAYQTRANAKLCILKDMINVRDGSLCKPTESRTVHSSSAPVQVTSLRQSVIGKDKLSFSFDITLSGNLDIFRDKSDTTPSSSFDAACPREARKRREVENKVKVEITATGDPIVENIKCGGLDSQNSGVVTLVSNKRTLTCTADLNTNRIDLEKPFDITLSYNILDNKETKVLVKHLADTS